MPDLTAREKNETIRNLLKALDMHGPGEQGHAERVAVYAVATGGELGLADEELLDLRYAATLHDVGKVKVDASLLNKLGRLEDHEIESMKLHAELSLELLEEFDWLKAALPMIIHHHERWDGQGYPTGLGANLIPIGSRIIAVAETFDVLTTDAGWKSPCSAESAINELKACARTQFDPDVVQAFIKVQPLIQPVGMD
ncbi:MAG: HD domain-containing protein [Chlorobia bacterium]|nr:HD domain-containing protein [Fimbriimonadaceae bacterium]